MPVGLRLRRVGLERAQAWESAEQRLSRMAQSPLAQPAPAAREVADDTPTSAAPPGVEVPFSADVRLRNARFFVADGVAYDVQPELAEARVHCYRHTVFVTW